MKFRYTTRFGPDGWDYDPRVEMVFTHPTTGVRIDVLCLIDSGASSVILDAGFAEALGITAIESGKAHEYQGISGVVRAYDHPLLMQVKGDTHLYPIVGSFMPALATTGLLGQRGFFEHYKVVFEAYKTRFELLPIPLNK